LSSRDFFIQRGLPLPKSFDTISCVPPTTAAVASSPKLLDRVRWRLRVKHYSIRTEQAYVDWIRRFILFHHKRHPNEMREPEITQFLTHLAVQKNVAASTQNQAFAALLFLYQQVLERKLDFIDNVQRVSRPAKLPVVFTPAEARAVLARLKGDYRLMAELLYGSGLRLMESVRLRVKDIDFGYNRITVRDGKGLRERVALLPRQIQQPLRAHLDRIKELHRQDLARGGRECLLAVRAETEISQRREGLDLAIRVPGGKTITRSVFRRNATSSRFRKNFTERGQTGDSCLGHKKGSQLPHFQTQLCDASA
jgi:site-specific recombinase XerD